MTTEEQAVSSRFQSMSPFFNELTLRLWAAAEANSLGHGGIAKVHRASGIARNTIARGQRDLKQSPSSGQTHTGCTM